MSYSDAYINVMCDNCEGEAELKLPFVFVGLKNNPRSLGHYDTTDGTLEKLAAEQGFIKTGTGVHLCQWCAEEAGLLER